MSIKLCRMSFDYIDDMHEILTNEQNVKYTGIDLSNSYNKTVKHVTFLIFNSNFIKSIAMVDENEDKLIGFINVYSYGEIVELAAMCNAKYQRKGYTYESICKVIEYIKKNKNIKEIYAKINKKNIKCINLVEKLNFKKDMEIKDKFSDEVIVKYSLKL